MGSTDRDADGGVGGWFAAIRGQIRSQAERLLRADPATVGIRVITGVEESATVTELFFQQRAHVVLRPSCERGPPGLADRGRSFEGCSEVRRDAEQRRTGLQGLQVLEGVGLQGRAENSKIQNGCGREEAGK